MASSRVDQSKLQYTGTWKISKNTVMSGELQTEHLLSWTVYRLPIIGDVRHEIPLVHQHPKSDRHKLRSDPHPVEILLNLAAVNWIHDDNRIRTIFS